MVKRVLDNPGQKPIQEVFVLIHQDGIIRKIPALDEKWVKLQRFGRYQQMPVKESDELANNFDALLGEWLRDSEVFLQQLQVVQSAEYYEFWSTMIHSKDFADALVSFLQNSNPCYVNHTVLYGGDRDSTAKDLYYRILTTVLVILHRLTSARHSDVEFMSEEDLGETLYKHYLITIPMIYDILATYGTGPENITIVEQLFSRIFQLQPKYKYDLLVSLKFVRANCLQGVERELEASTKSLTKLTDLILFCLDSVCNLRMLVDICPEVAIELFLAIELEQELTQFYDNILPVLYKNVVVFEGHDEAIDLLSRIRVEILNCFRGIINYHLDEMLRKKSDNIDLVEKVLSIYNMALTDHSFVLDYQNQFKVERDLELMRQACLKMDNFKADFILQAYLSDEPNYKVPKPTGKPRTAQEEPLPGPSAQSSATPSSTHRDYDQEASQVQDLFPHLGDGFIRKLLSRYENSEDAISAIIEGNLPPDMSDVDQTEPFIPEDPRDAVHKQTGIHRINVFAGDALDVLTNDELKCTVKYKGVTVGDASAKELFEDKSHLKETRLRYEQYAMVSEGGAGDEYDDEYDDSFDAMAESESKARRGRTGKQVTVVDESDEEEEEEEEEVVLEAGSRDRPKDAFCENPEVIRARREQAWQSKFRRGGGGGGGSGPKRDVVGTGTKGQGQSDAVLQNRQKKDQNKSSRANHNRRQGASWKRSRGMIPS